MSVFSSIHSLLEKRPKFEIKEDAKSVSMEVLHIITTFDRWFEQFPKDVEKLLENYDVLEKGWAKRLVKARTKKIRQKFSQEKHDEVEKAWKCARAKIESFKETHACIKRKKLSAFRELHLHRDVKGKVIAEDSVAKFIEKELLQPSTIEGEKE